MDAVGVELMLAPERTGAILAYLAFGIALGTCSGLIPGLHANNFALLLASMVVVLPGDPLLVGVAMLAAGVVHTFLDVIPALAIGVPDAEMAMMALPGHRMVLEGRGQEALYLSALGSGIAVLFAIPLAIPITLAMVRWYPVLARHMPAVLGMMAAVMVLTEPNGRAKAGGLIAFLVSAGFGWLIVDLEPSAPLDGGGVLAPLFAGLFGAPVILDALRGGDMPHQRAAAIKVGRLGVAVPATAGSAAGALVGYLPGVSSAIAAVVALTVAPNEDPDRGFIVATSGVDTANSIFALFALVALGTPRTGVLVAIEEADVPVNLPVMLLTVAIAAGVSFVLVIVVGRWYLEAIGSMDYTIVCTGVLTMLLVLSFLFAGVVGILIFFASAAIGFIPVRSGAKRVHLMGVLMGPIMVWTWQYPVPF